MKLKDKSRMIYKIISKFSLLIYIIFYDYIKNKISLSYIYLISHHLLSYLTYSHKKTIMSLKYCYDSCNSI